MVARVIGQATNLSPIKIDNTIYGLTGSMGYTFMNAVDMVARDNITPARNGLNILALLILRVQVLPAARMYSLVVLISWRLNMQLPLLRVGRLRWTKNLKVCVKLGQML